MYLAYSETNRHVRPPWELSRALPGIYSIPRPKCQTSGQMPSGSIQSDSAVSNGSPFDSTFSTRTSSSRYPAFHERLKARRRHAVAETPRVLPVVDLGAVGVRGDVVEIDVRPEGRARVANGVLAREVSANVERDLQERLLRIGLEISASHDCSRAVETIHDEMVTRAHDELVVLLRITPAR